MNPYRGVITREEMIEAICEFDAATDPSPFNTMAPPDLDYGQVGEWNDDRRMTWISRSPAEWLDVLLEVALNPPPDADELCRDWDYEIDQSLGEWSWLHPRAWLEKAAPLLNDPKARSIVLSAASFGARIQGEVPRALVPKLASYVHKPSALSDDELCSIIDILRAAETDQANAFLAHLRDTVPPERTEPRKYL